MWIAQVSLLETVGFCILPKPRDGMKLGEAGRGWAGSMILFPSVPNQERAVSLLFWLPGHPSRPLEPALSWCGLPRRQFGPARASLSTSPELPAASSLSWTSFPFSTGHPASFSGLQTNAIPEPTSSLLSPKKSTQPPTSRPRSQLTLEIPQILPLPCLHPPLHPTFHGDFSRGGKLECSLILQQEPPAAL